MKFDLGKNRLRKSEVTLISWHCIQFMIVVRIEERVRPIKITSDGELLIQVEYWKNYPPSKEAEPRNKEKRL